MNLERKGASVSRRSPIIEAMKLDKQLKVLLRDSDTTVAQLARASGVSAKTVYNWLAGQKPRDLDAVKKVADYFHVSIEKLCFGTEPLSLSKSSPFEKHLDEINAGIFEVVLRRPKR